MTVQELRHNLAAEISASIVIRSYDNTGSSRDTRKADA